MKTEPVLDPAAAFPDPDTEPHDTDLEPILGAAYPRIAEVLETVRRAHPATSAAWQYSNRSGWYRVALLKKRRLFYLIPRRNNFRLMFILGGKAVASLKTGPHARTIARLLLTAKRWPEGTEFRFKAKDADPALIAALIAAKLAH